MGSPISVSRKTSFKNSGKRGITVLGIGYICGDTIPFLGMSLITFVPGFLGPFFISFVEERGRGFNLTLRFQPPVAAL